MFGSSRTETERDEKRIHYVNTECFWWYIVWRTCFFEDHSSYLPKYHAPLHAIYSRYTEISMRFNLAVDEVDPHRFFTVVQDLQRSGNFFLSSYWDKTAFTKKRKRVAQREPCLCAVINCEWAIKYEHLLRSSITQGCVELKVINGRPVVGDGAEDPSSEKKTLGTSRFKRGHGASEEGSSTQGPAYDHGEDPMRRNERKVIHRQPQTEMQRQTMEFLRKARSSMKDFPLPEDGMLATQESLGGNEKGKESEGPPEDQEDILGIEETAEGSDVQQDFVRRLASMEPRVVEEDVKVVISKRIAKIHLTLEREAILRQIKQYSYTQLPTHEQ